MKHRLMSILVSVSILAAAYPVHASDCYADPVYGYGGNAIISSAVFMRDKACMDGSSILTTIPTGSKVEAVGYTDGWYYVSWNGGRGWIGQQFLGSGASKLGTVQTYSEFMSQYPSVKPGGTPSTPVSSSDPTLFSRVKGYILLQTQQHGEAWYADPISGKRYYMKDGPTAYQMMRSFGLGVTEADYAAMDSGNSTMKGRLRGRIVLRVQAHGEAYYIHPKTLAMHYLQNGDEAYHVMRLYSLGITDADLSKIMSAEIPFK